MARIVYRDPVSGQEQQIDIGAHRPIVVIGRNEDCTLRTSDASVSRYHVVIRYKNGYYTVNDPPNNNRAPTNGTFINGHRKQFRQEVQLHNRYEVRCGKFPIYFLDDAVSAPAPTPTPKSAPSGNISPYPAPQSQPSATHSGYPSNSGSGYPSPTLSAQGTGQIVAPFNPDAEQLQQLQQEVEKLEAEKIQQEQFLEKANKEIKDRDRTVRDMERRFNHHDTIVTGLHDQIGRLKEQADLQKEQVVDYREEIRQQNDKIEEIEFRNQRLKDELEAGNKGHSEFERALGDLKMKINVRDQQIKGYKRDLNLAQYEAGIERENVEKMELKIQQLVTSIEQTEQQNRDLKKILEQQEATITSLRMGR